MTSETAKKLNQLNTHFYETIGQHFNHTRNHAWEGWDKLESLLKFWFINQKLQVLELGCGNGRFLEFLLTRGFDLAGYSGLDLSDFLLTKARERLELLQETFSLKAKFLKQDILFDPWVQQLDSKGKHDLVVLFGVMHHIPGTNFRRELLAKAVDSLNQSGLLVFTTWQYLDVPRLSRRVVPMISPEIVQISEKYNLNLDEFEENDNILDWHRGKIAYRFSHYYTQSEIEGYCSTLGLKIVTTFTADGKEGNVNRYFVVQK